MLSLTNFFLFLLLGVFITPGFVVAANELNVTNPITLVLPSDGSQYSLIRGKFDSLTISGSSFSFTMSVGAFLDLASSDKKNLTNSLSAPTVCESGQSVVRLSLGMGASTQTVTVTPSGTCTAPGGAGGGIFRGVVGGGASPIQTSGASVGITQLRDRIAQLQREIARLAAGRVAGGGDVAGGAGMFTRDLERGSRDNEVAKLQTLLARDGEIYPEGRITGYYGNLTAAAVRRFQKKYGLPAVGRVGPLTRQKLEEVFK